MSTKVNTSYQILADEHTTSEINTLHPEKNAIIYDTTVDTFKIYRDDRWVDLVEYDNKFKRAYHLTVSAGNNVNLNDDILSNDCMIKLSWNGGSGTMALNLPQSSEYENRLIRFISDSTFENSTHTDLTPVSGDTLDGSTSHYRINKSYEGILVWSDGNEWFIVQRKA